jgi:hypothetical protein
MISVRIGHPRSNEKCPQTVSNSSASVFCGADSESQYKVDDDGYLGGWLHTPGRISCVPTCESLLLDNQLLQYGEDHADRA